MRLSDWIRAGALGLAPLLAAGCAVDDIDVKGVVRDAETLRPIPGAAVTIGEDTAFTDSYGFYEMDVDADDDDPYRVTVNAEGYESVSDKRLIGDDPDPAHVDFNLHPGPAKKGLDRSVESGGVKEERINVEMKQGESRVESETQVDPDVEQTSPPEDELDRRRDEERRE